MAIRSKALNSLAVLTVAGGASLSALQDVTLRYRWNPGETVRYRMSQEATSQISGIPGGGEFNVVQNTSQTFRAVTKSVAADGSATIEQIIDSVRMEMQGPMGNLVFDSEKKDAAPGSPLDAAMKQIFTPMVGATFTLVMSPAGTVQRVDGFSKVAEKMFAGMSDDPQAAGIFAGLKGSMNDEAVKGLFAQSFGEMPQRPVKAGDTWKNSFTIPNPAVGSMTTTMDATLQGMEGTGADQVAKIATKLTVSQDPNAKGTMPMGLTVKLGEATGTGEILFDVGKGQMRRSVTRMDMAMNMSGSAPDGTILNMATTVKSTVTIELLK
jgi:hypothetical protein